MAIAYVNSTASDAGGSGTGAPFNTGITVATGDFLIFGGRMGGSTTVTISSDRTTGDWASAIFSSPAQGDDGSILHLNYAFATSSGVITVTYAFGTAITYRFGFGQYTGIDTGTPFDKQTNNQSGGSTSTTPNTSSGITNANANALYIGLCTTGGDPTTISASGAWMLRQAALAGNRFAFEDQIVASTASRTSGFTLGSAQTYIAAAAIFNGAGGGGSTAKFRRTLSPLGTRTGSRGFY